MLLLELHRSEYLTLALTTATVAAVTALLLGTQVDDFLEPFDRVCGAELGCGEGKVVFDVEAGGSVEDCVVDAFGVVRRGDGEDAFVFGLPAKE